MFMVNYKLVLLVVFKNDIYLLTSIVGCFDLKE